MSIKPIEVFQFLKPEYIFIGKWCGGFIGMIEAPVGYDEKHGYQPTHGWCRLDGLDIDYTGDWKDSLFERPEIR